jgi:uncharacterized protein YjiS (DUF1127 family)
MARSLTFLETTTPATRALVRQLRALAAMADRALARRRDRVLLARMDAHLLKDIGLSPDAARTECAKPFWQE